VRIASRPVSRVLYGRRLAPPTRRPFLWDARLRAPLATNPSDRASGQAPRRLAAARVAPIRSCSRRGLPCRRRCRRRGALLPHPFTLTPSIFQFGEMRRAVCFLWRYPWGHPRRTLSGAVSAWSPDFPPPEGDGRPADWRNTLKRARAVGSRPPRLLGQGVAVNHNRQRAVRSRLMADQDQPGM